MSKLTGVHVRIPTKHLQALEKIGDAWGLDRSDIIRVAVSRLIEAETARLNGVKVAAAAEAQLTKSRREI